MPESILIVDETPTNRKLAQRVLAGAGYNVRAVPDAASALTAMPEFQPGLVLTDLRLAGMDGLALTRRIKEDPRTCRTVVIVVTGCDAEDDRHAAMRAGCDDFIVKPIDTRSLPGVVQSHLDRRQSEAAALPASAEHAAVELPAWAAELCREFLAEGVARSRELVEAGEAAAVDDVRRASHLWAGLGGTFGFPEITVVARRLECAALRGGFRLEPEAQALLDRLARLFLEATEARGAAAGHALPADLMHALMGKRVALVGFEAAACARIAHLFDGAQAEVRSSLPEAGAAACHLIVACAAGDGVAAALARRNEPVLLICAAPAGPHLAAMLESWAADSRSLDFAADTSTGVELLTRARRLLSRPPVVRGADTSGNQRPWKVVIADDDPTILSLLRTTVENSGMECAVAGEGDEALQLIRRTAADAAILDVMMPNMDGLEVLAAIRNDTGLQQVRVLMLSALQQETDIVRAFGLGADDYVTKPFSPVEVVARLKRLRRAAP